MWLIFLNDGHIMSQRLLYWILVINLITMWWIFLGTSIAILTPGDFGDQPTMTAMGLSYTPGKLLELRPDSCRLLDHAAWRLACDTRIALRSRRGCRGGARKQMILTSPIVTGQKEVTIGTNSTAYHHHRPYTKPNHNSRYWKCELSPS